MTVRCRSAAVPVLASCCVAIVLVLLATARAHAANVAGASLDMRNGQLCFPLHQQDSNLYYRVCLRAHSTVPQIRFLLYSAVAIANPALAAMPTYSQTDGLLLPVVHLSDGRVFSEVKLAASLEAGGALLFTVTTGRTVALLPNKSAARQWNEALLASIRSDLARPTVHARNLFHTALAMYDAWTAFDAKADRYLLGLTRNGFNCPFTGMPAVVNVEQARAEAISYAAYGLLKHRFAKSPGFASGTG